MPASETDGAPAGRLPAARGASAASHAGARGITIAIHDSLAAAEADWRAFEPAAECTVFQCFAWASAYDRTVARHRPLTPAIITVQESGETLLLCPFAVDGGGLVRRLAWYGSDLADYNAPLVARGFADRFDAAAFLALWRRILDELRQRPDLAFDIVALEKMPEAVGSEPNPFLALPVTDNASGAHLAHVTGDWDSYYHQRRSSATRRRDRTKLKRMAEIGPVAFSTPGTSEARSQVLSALMAQKSRAFARMGVADLFAKPGVRDFFLDLSLRPESAGFVHVSRFDVGDILAAANLGVLHRGRYYHILASYDDGPAARFGPGAAHLRALMEHAIASGCTVFDFTIGDEPYKLDWSDTLVRLFDYRAAVTAGGALALLPMQAAARAKRFIKQSPVLWKLATRVRTALGRLRKRPGDAADASGSDAD